MDQDCQDYVDAINNFRLDPKELERIVAYIDMFEGLSCCRVSHDVWGVYVKAKDGRRELTPKESRILQVWADKNVLEDFNPEDF